MEGFGVWTSSGPDKNCSGTGLTWVPLGCGEAGRRIGSLCAIEVEGLKRRPHSSASSFWGKAGGLGFGIVQSCRVLT